MLIEGSLKVDIFWILVHYISSILYCIMIMMLMNRNVVVIMDINVENSNLVKPTIIIFM